MLTRLRSFCSIIERSDHAARRQLHDCGPGGRGPSRQQRDGSEDREAFLTICLSTKHRVASIEVVARGTLNATLVHPREVFKGALLANAAALALVHNHPSGDPTPSPEDLALTRQLLAAGEIIGIRVVDHGVLGDRCFISLRETTRIWNEHPFHR